MAQLTNCWAGRFWGGKNERVDCGGHAAFNFQPMVNSFSVQAWIKHSSVSGPNTIFAMANNTTYQYAVVLPGTIYDVDFYVGGTKVSRNTEGDGLLLDDGGWHHVVLTVGQSGMTTARLYVDSVQIGSSSAISTSATADAHFVIGARNDDSLVTYDDYFSEAGQDAWIDEVGVWSTELTAAEVTALYNSGDGLMLDDDSGNYVSSEYLEGWWRIGDGDTEHSGTTPTTTVADMSGNLRHATYSADTPDIENFYDDQERGVPTWPGTCPAAFDSSSSLYPPFAPALELRRADQSVLTERTGFEGHKHRMLVTAVANLPYIDENVFVYEMARVLIGSPIRRPVFRRVATIHDMQNLTMEARTKFPHAYRTNMAELLAETTAKLDSAWQEVQYQMAKLALDLNEFGLTDQEGNKVLRAGGEATPVDREAYGMPPPYTSPVPLLSSSSSVKPPLLSSSSLVPPLRSSSSSLVPPPPLSSSSLPPTSSSFVWVDPYAFSETVVIAGGDVATRLDEDDIKTLFKDLGFARFGRDDNPLRTWDAFLRAPIDIPHCALIKSCTLSLYRHTTETGEDVVVRVYDIYDDVNLTPVGPFVSTDDPGYTHHSIIWDRLPTSGPLGSLDLTSMLQFFVDRSNHVPGDYFGLWIKEEQSDPGARRDFRIPPEGYVALRIEYRTDRLCSSSWMP